MEIDAQYHDGTVPFACVDDPIIIFMCGAIFKIISLERNIDSTWILKSSLAGNKEFDILNERILKLRQTKDLLMIFELLDQLNQSNQASIYSQQLIQQFPSDHPPIRRININSNVHSSRLLTRSKLILIDLTDDDLSSLAFAMLNVVQSLTNDSILIIDLITCNALKRELLLFGMRYIDDLCSNFKGNTNILQLLQAHREQIHLALVNAFAQVANNF